VGSLFIGHLSVVGGGGMQTLPETTKNSDLMQIKIWLTVE
jgi:hypothetical protein